MTQTLAFWKSSSANFIFQNHNIFYKQDKLGDEVILLLHGFPTASFDWAKMWPILSKHAPLLTLDFLGFGFSDKPHPHDYSIFQQVELVKALITHKKIKKVNILAHDYAVSVTQELLAQYHEDLLDFKITSICFLNGGMFSESYRPRWIQKLLLSKIGPFMVPFVHKGSLRRNFKAIFGPETQPSEQDIENCWELITNNNGKRTVPNVIQYLKDRKRNAERWTKAVQDAIIPLRLINGPEDPISGQRLIDKYFNIVKNPDVISLDGIGHYPNIEAPQKVADHYLDFFNQANR